MRVLGWGGESKKEVLRARCGRNILKSGHLENSEIDGSISLRWRLHKHNNRFGNRRNTVRMDTYSEYICMDGLLKITIALK